MLAREYRLPSTVKLTKSYFFKTPLFSVKYSKNELTESRFGFLVRKTVDKRAVARNRIRRVFRSCIEELLLDIVPGYDMLFFLEKGIIDKRQKDLCQELKTILQQKNLLQ